MKTLVIRKDLGHAMGLKPCLGRFRLERWEELSWSADTPLKVGKWCSSEVGYVIVARRVPSQKERIVFPPSVFGGELLNFEGSKALKTPKQLLSLLQHLISSSLRELFYTVVSKKPPFNSDDFRYPTIKFQASKKDLCYPWHFVREKWFWTISLFLQGLSIILVE